MKLLLSSLLALSVLVGVPVAFADIEDFSASLRYDDRVELFGIIEVVSLEERMNLEQVRLQVFDSNDNLVFRDIDLPSAKGSFMFKIPHEELPEFGKYNAHVTYYEQSATTQFEIEPKIIEEEIEEEIICEEGDKVENGACVKIIPNTVDTETHLRAQVAELEQRIETLENEKSLLEKTNEEPRNLHYLISK